MIQLFRGKNPFESKMTSLKKKKKKKKDTNKGESSYLENET